MSQSQPNSPKGASPSTATAREEWEATRAQTMLSTQIMRSEEDEPASAATDVGRSMSDNLWELFVSCDPGPAMQQQFEHLHPEFIAVHDIATSSSRRILSGIAAASKRHVQRLAVRRQGYGNTLATIEFVELPTSDGSVLRIYSTETDADGASRRALAKTLLAYSRLGVILVGDVPAHSVAAVLNPLRDDMIAGPWHNRHLLLLPLSSANPLVTQGMELARGTGVDVRTTPKVARPADAWNFISGTWTRLRQGAQPGGRALPRIGATPTPAPAPLNLFQHTEPAPTPTKPLPLRPMPAVTGPAAKAAAASDPLSRYVHQVGEVTGMVSCCIFEVASGRALMHAGASPGAHELGEHGAELLDAMLSTSRTLGLGHALPEAAITLGAHHLLLRAVPRHAGLALHAVLDKTHSNLTLARLQIQRMDALLDDPPAA